METHNRTIIHAHGERLEKSTKRYQGRPNRAPGRETHESRENLPEAPLGPRHASQCTEDGHKFKLLARERRRDKDSEKEGLGELESVELKLSCD